MFLIDLLRLVGPLVLAIGAAWVFDRLSARHGLRPPALVTAPTAGPRQRRAVGARRVSSFVLLSLVLYLGVFQSLGLLGMDLDLDFSSVAWWQMFQLHALFLAAIMLWFALGYVEPGRIQDLVAGFSAQLGLRTHDVGRELLIGAAAGIVAWLVVLSVLLVLAAVLLWSGAESVLPQGPPDMVVWMVGLPAATRLALSVSAGLFEELFFRGLLQPRIGIALSTAFFCTAHLSYESPFMLVGIAVLSLLFAALVRWRRNIWSAVSAHAMFDAIQLLILIPLALRFYDSEEAVVVVLWIVGLVSGVDFSGNEPLG